MTNRSKGVTRMSAERLSFMHSTHLFLQQIQLWIRVTDGFCVLSFGLWFQVFDSVFASLFEAKILREGQLINDNPTSISEGLNDKTSNLANTVWFWGQRTVMPTQVKNMCTWRWKVVSFNSLCFVSFLCLFDSPLHHLLPFDRVHFVFLFTTSFFTRITSFPLPLLVVTKNLHIFFCRLIHFLDISRSFVLLSSLGLQDSNESHSWVDIWISILKGDGGCILNEIQDHTKDFVRRTKLKGKRKEKITQNMRHLLLQEDCKPFSLG